ncbi:hypothetical protein CDV31_002054 [Fusarium ambrosium]|uniref:Xylanolytic transcriptional activator regulatory domain-containing protein n=1 Tax=Fusarium ambrosium TaxID=131363 RepID=A0A428UXU8_9HYPO|nr:hypothetical protein CDV31_002054 [Fusarium ambrosium]
MIEKCGKNLQMLECQANTNHDTPLHLAVKKLDSDIEQHQEDQTEAELHAIVQGLDRMTLRKTLPAVDGTGTPKLPQGSSEQQDGNIRPNDNHLDESPALTNVKLLVQACPEALGIKNGQNRTPYQEREHFLQELPSFKKAVADYAAKHESDKKAAEQRAQRILFVEDPIASYIRSYCIRNSKTREKTMTRLYRSGQERHIEFDLAGMPRSVVPSSYLEQLANHLRFESILKYVALPNMTIEPVQKQKRRERNPAPRSGVNAPRPKGRTDLIKVFDWLWQNGVREILKVMVVDNKDPPHADSAIVEALEGFKVEEWDWKRVDLCSDVISNASLFVREASLYASGNNAVMMGWASAEGLGNRVKFPKLEKVNIFVREGLEDSETWERYNRALKQGIEHHASKQRDGGCSEKAIDVQIIPDMNEVSFSSEFLNSDGYIDHDPAWITSVRDFATFLKQGANLQETEGKKVTPLRIAIIDDGIDATVSNIQHRIGGGATFCPYPHSSDLMNPYFAPSGDHGTLMAQLICRMCPDARLYIARLEELQTLKGTGRRFTATSAAKAVKWATDCGVDIISMSWTIQTAAPNSPEMEELRAAISNASQQNIIMFCSASDQGSHNTEASYPGNWNLCLRVGGATFTGEKLMWVEDSVEFWFPGHSAPLRSSDAKSTVYESGSSVATAMASGLAGVLIYCARLLGGSHQQSFRGQECITRAFRAMSSGNERKFPRTEEILSKKFKEKIKARNPRGTKKPDIASLEWNEENKKALEDLFIYIKRHCYLEHCEASKLQSAPAKVVSLQINMAEDLRNLHVAINNILANKPQAPLGPLRTRLIAPESFDSPSPAPSPTPPSPVAYGPNDTLLDVYIKESDSVEPLNQIPIKSLYEITRLKSLRSRQLSPVSLHDETSPRMQQPLRDLVSEGRLDLEDAERLTQIFLNQTDHFLYGIASRFKDLESIRRCSSLLFTAICTVSALHEPQGEALFDICSSELRRLISEFVFAAQVSIEDFQGLCIASFWLSDISWSVSSLAIRRAMEFQLARSFDLIVGDDTASGRSGSRLPLSNPDDALCCLRMWYLFFICDRHLSILYGRPSTFGDEVSVVKWQRYLDAISETSTDVRLASQIELLLILDEVIALFGIRSAVRIPVSFQSRLEGFNHQLDRWIITWGSRYDRRLSG